MSPEVISSRRFGGWPITLPTTGPKGIIIFIRPVGRLRFGALRPLTLATVSIASRMVVTGPLIT